MTHHGELQPPEIGLIAITAMAWAAPAAFIGDILVRIVTSVIVGLTVAICSRYLLPRIERLLARVTAGPRATVAPPAPRDPPPPSAGLS